MNEYGDFNHIWKGFEESARGKLIEKSKQSPLNAAAARIAVSAAAIAWTDKYTPCGKWLAELNAKDAQKARRISELVQSIDFVEVPPQKQISDLGVIGVSAGSAVIGAGISSHFFHTGVLGSAASAVLPAAVIYPIMKAAQSDMRRSAEKKLIEQYVGQLNDVRIVILEILEN